MTVHIIIPAIDEAENLQRLLPYLVQELDGRGQIIVADGGSQDNSAQICSGHGVTFFKSPKTGRGPQMNAAVSQFPEADVYYFLHADARPPKGFYRDLLESVDMGYPVGCYRFKFDSYNPLLAINSFFTRFSPLACRGGDQSLYMTRRVFEQLGGFKPEMQIMEDYDIIERARAKYDFRIIPRAVTVSARKYRANNYLKVQLANLIVFRMYRRGARQEAMIEKYRSLLN